MKTIGLIGGLSWESTATYYRLINQGVKTRLGGFHSAKLIVHSVDFAEVEVLQRAERWGEAGAFLGGVARSLRSAGADFVMLGTNTMHLVAPAIEAAVTVPFLHIADPTALAIRARGLETVALLGTRFTMEKPFYLERLRERHKLSVVVPGEADRKTVHRIIYEELTQGVVLDASRTALHEVIERLGDVQGVILGCTELSMLTTPELTTTPLFDTTELHAAAAVELALQQQP